MAEVFDKCEPRKTSYFLCRPELDEHVSIFNRSALQNAWREDVLKSIVGACFIGVGRLLRSILDVRIR